MNPNNPVELMTFAASRGTLRVFPMLPHVRKAKVIRKAGGPDPREPRRRLVEKEGRIVLASPEAVVQNIKGDEGEKDIYLIVHIPRRTYDEMASPIIIPGRAGA